MKKHVFQRTVSFLLVLCMMMGMLPFAQAAGEKMFRPTQRRLRCSKLSTIFPQRVARRIKTIVYISQVNYS